MTENQKQLFFKTGFTWDQIAELEAGMEKGLNIATYANKNLLAIQMRQIRLGMEAGLLVEKYADPKFDWFQMEEIRLGLIDNVDVNKYAIPKIPYDKMRQIRLGLESGIDMSKYLYLPSGILKVLREALLCKLNIIEFINEGYDAEQLEEIRIALLSGVDIKPYLLKEYRGPSIGEIRQGLENNLDVSVYAKIELSWMQMREIRLGMENRIDYTIYENPLYDFNQMREIRLGLQDDIDVSSYCSLMNTANEMKKKRLKIMNSSIASVNKEAMTSTNLNHGVDKSALTVFDDFTIEVSPDMMTANVVLKGDNRRLDKNDLQKALTERGIIKGVTKETIDRISNGKFDGDSSVIAVGKEPVTGDDGYYEYFFDTGKGKRMVYLEDGSIDYEHSEWFEIVNKAQKVVFYHEATNGEPGYTVYGDEIPSRKGHNQRILEGSGFVLQADKHTYIAAYDGRIELKDDGRVIVSPICIMDELTMSKGRAINFNGCVYIKGRVGDGTRIEATEDVIVDGFVEGAVIECGGNILFRQGVNANGGGYVHAGGTIFANFFENASVIAGGDIRANSSMASDLSADGTIFVTKSIVGGEHFCMRGIEALNIGNSAGIETSIKIGINDKVVAKQQLIDSRLKSSQEELDILTNAYREYQVKYPVEKRNTMEVFLKLEDAIYTKKLQLNELKEEKDKFSAELREIRTAKAVIKGNLYDGVMFEINSNKWIALPKKNVSISNVSGRVKVYSLDEE